MRRLAPWLLALALAGCDRPTPLNAPPRGRPAVDAGRSTPESCVATPELVRRYLAADDPDARRVVLWQLHETPASEGLPAMAQLLATERDPELRIELLDSLDVWDGGVETKLGILRTELLDDPSPGEVREAAIDALLNLQDARTVVIWRELLDDPSAEVRDVARDAIDDWGERRE